MKEKNKIFYLHTYIAYIHTLGTSGQQPWMISAGRKNKCRWAGLATSCAGREGEERDGESVCVCYLLLFFYWSEELFFSLFSFVPELSLLSGSQVMTFAVGGLV